ncbi:hypothetical protein J437_LFUL008683 [Ladona fulva]|uniref:Transposase n=1 Tax=Ladona fulva TaxID=123851 RepID=A0A8K0P2H9_LADFU|nr:hypothetical protein J437_LFUL008683 [Ladona fulva]
MSIKPSFAFNSRSDCIDGFEDHGSRGRSTNVAREALVFMVRGLRQKWKQPVAFYFSHKATPGVILADLIREVLGAPQSTGLKIAATVCDMGSNNILALRILGSTLHNPCFCFNGQEIFTLHDPPHLLKCTRNMFQKYPVRGRVQVCGEVVTDLGRWSHIRELVDSAMAAQKRAMISNIVPFCELTEAHLNPTWRQKMKVRLAAEVFSTEVVKTLEWSRIFGMAPMEKSVTTSFLCFIHDLFQSLNGVKSEGDRVGLKLCVWEGSPHLEFWGRAAQELKDWEFMKEGRKIKPRSWKGWAITIEAAKQLWVKLKEAGFSYLEPRRLNQDPLENFFGCIQFHCGTARNPTMEQFTSAFKSSIIRDISSHWSRRMNCLPDDDSLMAELEEFIQMIPSSLEETEDSIADNFDSEIPIVEEEAAPMVSAESFMTPKKLSMGQLAAYLCGKVMVLCWKEKKDVFFLSKVHDSKVVEIEKSGQKSVNLKWL